MTNWTQIFLALINTVGAVFTAFFAARAQNHAKRAGRSATEAKMASLRPPMNVTIEPPSPDLREGGPR